MPNKIRSDALYNAFMDIVKNDSPEQAIGELESLKMLYFNRCAFLKWKEN